MDPGLLLALLAALGVSVLLVVGLRFGDLSGTAGGVSSGIAGALAEVDAALQPQRPRPEQLVRLRAGETDDDDETDDEPGDGRVPK